MPKLIQTHTVFTICKLLTKATKIRVENLLFRSFALLKSNWSDFAPITHDERATVSEKNRRANSQP